MKDKNTTQQNKKTPNFYLKKKKKQQQFAGQFQEVNLFPFSKINGKTIIWYQQENKSEKNSGTETIM